MKGLWDELDTLDTFTVCGCACSCGAKEKNVKAKHDVRLVQFLMGLNDSYCAAKGNILMISHLPSMSNAYGLLIQEEKQREMNMNPKFPGENSSFVAFGLNTSGQRPGAPEYKPTRENYYENKKSAPTCRYCKKIGHTIEQCYKIHGFPPNFKFSKNKNSPNYVHGNVAMTCEATGNQFYYNVDPPVSRPDFSSHDGTYYNPPVGKPTRNPEQQVMGLRVETKQE
ncbi:hypothetical protein KY290_017772 [Solanum tuberosum]|uniref:Uncharacterized protein n=1 Tax=Solanum tuberosum TaxID=4113 RepID=A0ABQ7VC91_SOLTU|nr:hypothetical protein KY290_017772 [Solanum tuberosum]